MTWFARSHGSWVASLANTFKTAGLQNVIEDRRVADKWHLAAYHEVNLLALSLNLAEGSYICQLVESAIEEFQENRGVAITFDKVTVLGQRPQTMTE